MTMYRCKWSAIGSKLLHGILLLLLLALVSPATALQAAPQAQIPPTFNYQGTLRDTQGNLVTGVRNMTFRIYDAVIAGTKLHEETINNVSVRDGVFNVVLGDSTPLNANVFANGPRFIGITIAPDAKELIPRQRLHPVPWAQLATNATNATNAANAATATTLVPNATLNGAVTIKNSPLYLNNNNTWVWDIRPDANGVLRFVELNSGFLRLSINPNGNVQVPGDFTTRSVSLDSGTRIDSNGANVIGKVTATLGFNGRCIPPGFGWDGSCNQDVAETFGTDQRTEPGDLVVFIPEDRTFPAVQLATRPYEGAIVGVVSTDPGLVFDQGETRLSGDNRNLITDKKTVVAMVGRVPTKFSLENGPIAVGDPLTSSSTPGAAMKATQAGRIIGYAMQSSAAAVDGKLLVWLQLSTYIPAETLAALNGATLAGNTSNATIASLEAQVAALTKQVEAIDVANGSTRWPWSLPLFGGLLLIGVVVGVRNRFQGGL